MPKFASEDPNGDWVRHDYGNIYFREPCGEVERLVIGPSDSQIKLLDELAATFPTERYFILYVLLMSHVGRNPGRYQSPIIESQEDLQLFIWTFQEFFEGDGRHHLWIACADSTDLLIYDQHDVFFAYGDLDRFEGVLVAKGFSNTEFWFPSPHSHSYDPRNSDVEEAVMAYFDWAPFELQPGDDWD